MARHEVRSEVQPALTEGVLTEGALTEGALTEGALAQWTLPQGALDAEASAGAAAAHAVPTDGRRRRPGPLTIVALGFVGLVALLAVIAPWLAPDSALEQDLLASSQPPGAGHLLGTDQLGRDVVALLIAGIRPAVAGPLAVAALCMVIGASAGMLAAYRGRATDAVISRGADLIYTLPGLVVAIVVVGIVDGGYWLTVAIFVLLSVPFQVRIARSAAAVQVRLPYVDAARTLGLPTTRVLARHVFPNIRTIVLTTFLLDLVGAFIGFASLAYLGVGSTPGSASWGVMVAEGQQLLTVNPWISLAPAVLLMLTASSITLIGDWVDDIGVQRTS